MQTLHYKEATLAHAGIHNPSSGSDVANLAQVYTESHTLLLEHQAHLVAIQQQMVALTADNLPLSSAQAHPANPPETITVDAQAFAGSTVDTKSLVDIIKDTIIQQSQQSNCNRGGGSNCKSSTTRSSCKYSNNTYCWTHGADLHDSHTSATCEYPAEGHQADTTIDNRKGCSTKNLKLLRRNSNGS